MLRKHILGSLAAGAALAMAGQAPAAQTYQHTMNFNPNAVTCGFFQQTGLCIQAQAFDQSVQTQVGDVFDIRVDMTERVYVPASSVRTGFYVDVYDTAATFGPGGPGSVQTLYQLEADGLLIDPDAGAPFGGPSTTSRNYDYLGTIGHFDVASDGFSMTGLDARLEVLTADPLPSVGISAGWFWVLDEIPQTVADLPGGTEDSPLILPTGLTGQVTGNIGGGVTEQFYNFRWDGGLFQTRASVDGAEPGSEFTFKLFGGDFKDTALLDDANGYSQLFTATLDPGYYTIGLAAGDVPDPLFTIDFLTPVSGAIPEPSTWTVMILGFGGLGVALRRRRGQGVAAT